ncbi:MAG: AMP-dependent synthetase/ligase [Myxococcota bacterium]
MPLVDNLVSLLQRSLERHASRIAFGERRESRWHWIQYEDFAREIDEVRSGLAVVGIGPGDRVALLSNNRLEWAVVAYAAFGLGAVVVPIYPAQGIDDWRHIVSDSGARLLVCATQGLYRRCDCLLESIPTLEARLCFELPPQDGDSYRRLRVRGREAPLPARPPKGHDIATILYTSGTSGPPKGVVLTHRAICANLESVAQALPLSSQDRSLSFLPWALAFGQTCELHLMLSVGGSIAICHSSERFLDDLIDTQPTLVVSVPRMFARLYDRTQQELAAKPRVIRELFTRGMQLSRKRRQGRLSMTERLALETSDRMVLTPLRQRFGVKLRFAFSGGATLSPEISEFVADLGLTVYEGYGLTEAGPVVSANRPTAAKLGSVGRPLDGVRVVVEQLDTPLPSVVERERSTGAKVAPRVGHEAGELLVYSEGLMQSYWNLPEQTADAFTEDGALRTGDIGYLDDDGFLFITGRLDEQYKLSSGKDVAPARLEQAIRVSPYIRNIMVWGEGRDYNVAIVVVDLDAMNQWADERDLRFPNTAELLDSTRVRHHIMAELGERTAGCRPYERIRDIVLTARDFSADNGLLTPTLRLKRGAIFEHYEVAIESLYDKRRTT